jgi:hypothetical protein
MTPLTPDQREYKEKTLEQLETNLPRLEAQLQQESRREVANSLQKQVDDTRAHIEVLQHELATNAISVPVADELYQKAAAALANKKFFLAKKLITKLETIEPFYPGISQLREEAEEGRASRRTRAIAQRGVPATDQASRIPGLGQAAAPLPAAGDYEVYQPPAEESEKRGIGQFFQFHYIISCLVVLLILCVMMGIGGVMLLQYLIEGA